MVVVKHLLLSGGRFALAIAALGCGDPVLPGDYAGPPASSVSGTLLPGVDGISKDVARPQLALVWLPGDAGQDAHLLVDQPVSYQRSSRLQNDWDIGVALPSEAAKFQGAVAGGGSVRIAVAKVVYFDDRNGDGRLDWSCDGPTCDQVKALSQQFVVYVDNPPYCQMGDRNPAGPRLTRGYHYFSFDGGVTRELAKGEGLSFTLDARTLSEVNPAAELRAFVAALLRSWAVSPLGGC